MHLIVGGDFHLSHRPGSICTSALDPNTLREQDGSLAWWNGKALRHLALTELGKGGRAGIGKLVVKATTGLSVARGPEGIVADGDILAALRANGVRGDPPGVLQLAPDPNPLSLRGWRGRRRRQRDWLAGTRCAIMLPFASLVVPETREAGGASNGRRVVRARTHPNRGSIASRAS